MASSSEKIKQWKARKQNFTASEIALLMDKVAENIHIIQKQADK